MDNLIDLINTLKIFQKADYIHVKDEKLSNNVYYKYDKVIELLEEIEKIKEEDYEKRDNDYERLEY